MGKRITELSTLTTNPTSSDYLAIDNATNGTKKIPADIIMSGVAANQNIAGAFDDTSTYAVGDYVIYNSILYKCTTAISTAGAWDSTKWTACVVTDEMGQGGGGTTIIANPQGYATDTLRKIQVGNVIYGVSEASGATIYGFHIDGSESDPDSMITYLEDAVGKTPVHMDYTNDIFDYGSWGDAWFIQECKPCILNQDGTVQCYLNPNNYAEDINGNAVTIDETLTSANVMIEFPKIYIKIVPDNTDSSSASIYISDSRVDILYHDYAYIDENGVHKEHFYLAAYNPAAISNTLRSVSGQTTTKIKSLTVSTEITYAEANGTGWSTEHAGQVMLVNLLLMLIGKSTDTQTVFGQGLSISGSEAVNDNFQTGVHNTKGLFYGTNSDTASTYANAVKVFGIENWWGFQWRRYAGHVMVSGQQKIKLSYDTSDGSTVTGYNTTGSGYIGVGATPSGTSGGYISKMTFNSLAMLPSIARGSSSTYYCDGLWFNNSGTTYALRGGSSNSGSRVGAFCVNLTAGPERATWDIGAALSYC